MDLSAELRARLGQHDHRDAGPLVGIEHEFVVHDADGPIDFRQLLPGLSLDGRRLDPSDPMAVRGRWGGVITADGREAEIATPPVTGAPGFSDELTGWVTTGTSTLRRAIGPSRRLEGYSTHISVQVDDRRAVRTARRFAKHFALPQMLLLDRTTSPGLLVRPRRGRLELCGEYVAGDQRRAAAVFAVAATAAASGSVGPAGRRLPPAVRPRSEPARGRYGIYVDRRAYANGLDLYLHGRRTPIHRTADAQEVLLRTWEHVRPFATARAAAAEVGLVDAIVEGRSPLPIEHAVADVADRRGSPSPDRMAPTGAVVVARRRGPVLIEAVVATWNGSVLRVSSPHGNAFVTVPRHDLEGFLVALDGGVLDDVLDRAVAAAPSLPLLLSADQLDDLDVYGGIGSVDDLVPDERDPITGRLGGAGGGGGASRRNKDRHDPPKTRRVSRWLVGLAAFFGALLLLAALAAAVTHKPEDQQVAAGGPSTTTLPPAGPTPGWSGTVSVVEHHVQPVTGSDATTQPFNLGTSTGGTTFVATFNGEVDADGNTMGVAKASIHDYFDHDGYFCYGNTSATDGSGSGPVTLGFFGDERDQYPFSVTYAGISERQVSTGNSSPGCDHDVTQDNLPVGGTNTFGPMIGGAGPETVVDEPPGVRSGTRTYVTESDDTILVPAGDGSGTYTNTPAHFRQVIVVTWRLTRLPDRDHDGYPDATDKCPSTTGPAVSTDGCVPPDADGDGLPDAADQCPDTPAKAPVDENGCPTNEPRPLSPPVGSG